MKPSTTLGLGDEAIAWGAMDAGISGAFSYPGTPATEILEAVQSEAPHLWSSWSANEKVAYEEALGMSYAGCRALVAMKHVGLNVAADPFINSAITGVNAGLVLAVADDPGMNSSQNEQDSRFYADFAKVPCFEPSDAQEAYDMTRAAFDLSERFRLPVMVRITTRTAHGRSKVKREKIRIPNHWTHGHPDPMDWTLVPTNARRRYEHLLSIQEPIRNALEDGRWNPMRLAGPRGILCSGAGWNDVRECLGAEPRDSILRIGAYPLPLKKLNQFFNHCREVLIVEDGYPLIESKLRGLKGPPGVVVRGKTDGGLPPLGALTPELVDAFLTGRELPPPAIGRLVVPRPPQLCKGCPHSDSFGALRDAVAEYPDALLFGDIGCYTLGAMPPFKAVHTCVDMGASIGMAHGAVRAGAHPVICTIGDSTFAHSGMPALLGAVRSDARMTVAILDNATTAMTGAQDSFATGETLLEIVRGLGVKDLCVIEPLRKNHSANVEAVKSAIEHPGLSVIVARRECIHYRRAGCELPLRQEGE